MLLLAAAAGCATRSAPDMKGRWEAVNRFPETTEAIPLNPPNLFYPTARDATLKALLARWAKDSNRTLSYTHPNDFTLHAPVARIRTADLQKAAALLTAAYADQGVSIAVDQEQIIVRATDPPGAGGAALPGPDESQEPRNTAPAKAER